MEKIRELRRMCNEQGADPWIEVDGGVGPANAYKVRQLWTRLSSKFGPLVAS